MILLLGHCLEINTSKACGNSLEEIGKFLRNYIVHPSLCSGCGNPRPRAITWNPQAEEDRFWWISSWLWLICRSSFKKKMECILHKMIPQTNNQPNAENTKLQKAHPSMSWGNLSLATGPTRMFCVMKPLWSSFSLSTYWEWWLCPAYHVNLL